MGGGHLADMKKLRKQGAKLQDVVDFFLKKVKIDSIRQVGYNFKRHSFSIIRVDPSARPVNSFR